MELLSTSLPFLKVLSAFGLMLVGMRNKIGLAASILSGGVFMGLIFGVGIGELAKTSVLAFTREKFLFLVSIVGLIMVLSDALEQSGQSRRLMDALSGYLTSIRLRLIFFPALIGLLPMPGGAIFSAPMVKAVGEELQLNADNQAIINYWFRHVWEMAWPLYPGIILTVSLADIPIAALISKTWPGVIAMFGFGWLFLLRSSALGNIQQLQPASAGEKDLRMVLREGFPLLLAIIGAIGLETGLAKFTPHIPFEWGVIIALIAAVTAIMVQNRLGGDFVRQLVGKKSLWAMLSIIAAVFIFKDIMQVAGIVEEMASAAGSGVALFAAAVFLPFIVGMVAGINVAFVGATFPLLLGLLHSLGMEARIVPFLVLASFSGFTGVMISPIHICFVLTCNFFGADLAKTWRRLVAPCMGFALSGGALFLFLSRM